MAKTLDKDTQRLCDILRNLKKEIIRRAIIAYDRSPETFGEEIVALNDIDEAVRNNCE
ncbi:MAG: hypothetical protein HYU02_08820 [Thaumarchaeota archaeon]|nr:hypothetical protein [Nitrososphaerota archaeon]